MIKRLKRKFIFWIMAIATFLIVVFVGAVNISNLVVTEQEINKTIDEIILNETRSSEPTPPSQSTSALNALNEPTDPERVMSMIFFTARVGSDSTVTYLDITRTSYLDEETATSYLEYAVAAGDQRGNVSQFRYGVSEPNLAGEKTYVFLDIKDQSQGEINVALISGGAGVAILGIVLALSFVIAKKAIQPFVDNQMKQKQFITNASHDIKTPLAVISANIEAMELYNGENKWSKNVKSQTNRLNDLLNKLLSLSKAEEETASEKSDVDMSSLTESVLSDFDEVIKNREINLQKSIAEKIVTFGNQSELREVISILIDNACKYIADKGKLDVSLKKANNKQLLLEIGNDVDSVPAVSGERLFDRFYRRDESRSSKKPGHGIGLSVAKAVIENHKGSISADYVGNNFIQFRIVLPLRNN